MANIQELSESSFETEVLSSATPVLVDFWAPWCGPCRKIAPLLEQFALENAAAIKVFKVNTDENMNLATGYRIDSIPTLILFKDGQVVERFVGFDKFRLQEAVSQIAGNTTENTHLFLPRRCIIDSSALLSPELLAKLENFELVSRKIFRGRMKGERRSPRKGQSVEFADFRNYVPGDDLRFVDWNTYARLEKLFLKMFLEEEDLHFYALIDASASMDFGEPTKLRYAVQLAAALGFVGLVRGDRVKIETLGQPAGRPAPVFRGRKSLWRMIKHLEEIQGGESVSLAEGVKNFCIRNTGRGIVVLLSDLMDKTGYEAALRYLLSRDLDVYVIQILSAAEIDPDITGDLRLIDCEDADMAEVSVTPALMTRYKRTLAAFIDDARQFCTKRGMIYLLARNEVPVEDLVGGYLRNRGLVR